MKKEEIMRKMTSIIVALICIITSCKTTAETTGSRDRAIGKQDITRALDLKGFNKISLSGIKTQLTYKQAKEYSVKVTTTEKRLETVNIYKENGWLHIKEKQNKDNTKKSESEKYDEMKIEICSPQLKEFVGSGMSEASLGDISGNTKLRIETNGMSHVRTEKIKTKDVSLSCKGMSTMTAGNINCSGKLQIDNQGMSKVTADCIDASHTTIDNGGMSIIEIGKTNGTALKISQSGKSIAKMAFKGKSMEISNSGMSDTNVSVECEKLRVENSGMSTITLFGYSR